MQNEHRQAWEALKSERSLWVPQWQDIADNLLPRAGRFFVKDKGPNTKQYNDILDESGTLGLEVLAAGMQAGMNSPARPWFRMSTSDPELAKVHDVKVWLDHVTRILLTIFHKSNFYRAMHAGYEELGAFGTWACMQQPSFKTVTHFSPLTAGEFAIATNFEGTVDTVFRHFEMTVGQMVAEFGEDKCSNPVQQAYRQGRVYQKVEVVHAVRPRIQRDSSKQDGRNMPFESVYFELGANKDSYLRISGFKEFPGWGARWHVRSNATYGHSPAMTALGSVRQLQQEQWMKGKAIAYQADPPVQVPTSLRQGADLLPGGVSYYDAGTGNQGIRSAFEVPLNLQHLQLDIVDVRARIDRSFHVDLFRMLASSDRTGMTATEVAQRYEEKMVMLGPVLERVTHESHVPAVNNTFDAALRAGILPPPPDDLAGQDINVEFVSMLAQAQRAVSTTAVDRYVANLGAIAQIKPEVLDRFNADHWAEDYADMTGVSPDYIVAGETAALIRKQRAQAAQQQQAAEAAAQSSQAVRNLAQASSQAPDIMTQLTGYTGV